MPTKLAFTVRKYHKWLSLIIGVQALLWLASGVYMVVMNLDFIHGDHLVQHLDDPLPTETSAFIPFSVIRSQFPEAHEIALEPWRGMPHYRVYEASEASLIDATTGSVRSPLTEADAIAVARYHYTGNGEITATRLLTERSEAPSEIQGGALPLWQIKFNDFGNTVFYISPELGKLVRWRHTFWRVFDFVWMLHIMDYENRTDVNNNIFRVAAVLGLVMSVFGLWLLYFSFRRNRDGIAQPEIEGPGK